MRRPRIHRAGALYYLRHISAKGQVLFEDAADYSAYILCLNRVIAVGHARLLAFGLESCAAHMAVRVSDRATSFLMRSLGVSYAHAAHGRRRSEGQLFSARHRALLVDDDYVGELVRYIHWRVAPFPRCPDDSDGLKSSHSAYLGQKCPAHVDISELLSLFDSRIKLSRGEYQRFMSGAPLDRYVAGFEHGLPGEPRVFGSPMFLRRHGLDVTSATKPSLADAIRSICLYCGISEEQLIAGRRFCYARALAAWYVKQRDITTLTKVSEYLDRHWSSLLLGIDRYQAKTPDLFDVDAIRAARPLIPVPEEVRAEEAGPLDV